MKHDHRLWVSGFLLLLTFGCAAKPLPKIIYPKAVYPMSHYPVSAESEGLAVAAVPFAPGRDIYGDPSKPADEQAKPSLNVLDAGIWPVRLIVLNETGDEITIDPSQIIGMAGPVSYRTTRRKRPSIWFCSPGPLRRRLRAVRSDP